ncbi:radical SAM protein [Ignicoccus pacificus DSM 13166]|uniref:Radical SAM protein n=1 Tax=Ignicoccus pacificus DSM 13166 TaxID=940294 RepID=A0A977PJ09_9CREN|nr:radical SAM protein [Ignicoccus pacificus DSM 13166]
MKKVLYLHLNKKNTKYSTAALVAAIESSNIVNVKVEVVNDPLDSLNFIGKYEKVVLGVSLLTTDLLNDNLISDILKLKGKVLLIAGGPHATGDPYGTLDLGFDVVVAGEGEETLPELLYALAVDDDIRNVKGLYLEEYEFTGRRRLVDLDSFPPWPYWRGHFGPIEITRGCPFACAYCQTSFMFKAITRHRSIDKIIFYTKKLKELGGKDWRVVTPNALSYGGDGVRMELDKVEELLSKVKDIGVRVFFGSFPSEVRPEFVTEESIRILKKYVNNKRLVIGAQSASDRMLKILHRGHAWEDVVSAVELSVKHGFVPEVDFILGLPFETEEDMEATLKGMRKLTSMGARAHLHYFMPLPGTPFTFFKPTRLPPKIRKEVAKLVGEGKGWGQWLQQERIAWEIVKMIEEGRIKVRPPRASRPGNSKLINPLLK